MLEKGTPRPVVNIIRNNNILKVKYPNGYIQKRLQWILILIRTVLNKDHLIYWLLVKMPAARTQYKKPFVFCTLKRGISFSIDRLTNNQMLEKQVTSASPEPPSL